MFNICKYVIYDKAHDMLKDYTTIKSKNRSTEKFPKLDLVLYNSKVATCSTIYHSQYSLICHHLL